MISRLPPVQAIVLVGFMGAGKSSVGRFLAEQLGWTFEDLDDRIERREKQAIAKIFRNAGEAEFRRAEHAALQELLKEVQGSGGKVIALGGGAFVQETNISLIEAANLPTIFLDAGVDELWGRCQRQWQRQELERPLLGGMEEFRRLYEKRRPHYVRAWISQDTDGKSIEEIAAELIQALGLSPRGVSQGEV